MHTYHVTFYPNIDKPVLACHNVVAKTMLDAYLIHIRMHPDKEPLYIHCVTLTTKTIDHD